MAIAVHGIDLGKNSCSVVGLNRSGEVVLRRRLHRDNVIKLARGLAPCVMAMEGCCGAHHLGRILRDQGHEVRLMSPEYVRPCVKSHTNDDWDAEAIAEAATRPTMRHRSFPPTDQCPHTLDSTIFAQDNVMLSGRDMSGNDASRRFHLRSLSSRIDRFLTRLERIKRPPNRRERYHLVEAMQHLYEGRSEEVEAALARAEKIEPLPPHLTAQLTASDSVTVANLREGLSAIRQQHEKD